VGDFNRDGRADLAVANFSSDTVSVLLNTTPSGAASPSFATQQKFSAGGTGAWAVAVSDLDGDGRPDLAVTNYYTNTVSVLVNTTLADASFSSFAAPQSFAVGTKAAGVAAADFSGDGRPNLVVANAGDTAASVLTNTTAPFANSAPVLVAQFAATGVWEFNRTTGAWVQLSTANASLLAADTQGDVVGMFPGYGVLEYTPANGWTLLNGTDATALAMDARGDIVARFPGYGVGEYLPAAGWRILTPSNATLLAMDAQGDVAGEFPGYGIQLYRPAAGWTQINGVDASLLAMNAQGEVVANFPGYGVGAYLPATGWKLLNGVQAQSLAVDALGNIVAEFQGYGVGEYLPAAGWRSLTPADAARVAVTAGEVFAEFAGYGVQEYDPYRGWYQLNAADASALVIG
jgi:hypothetical protein